MKKLIIFLLISAGLVFFWFFYLVKQPGDFSKNIEWGVVFSRPFSIDMGLNWKKNYLAILDELKPKILRLPVYWKDVQVTEDEYDFKDYDWMVKEAENRGVKLLLAVGRKAPRWPECDEPKWTRNLDSNAINQKILDYIEKTVNQYKNSSSTYIWQVENEPFLNFGECPKLDVGFLDQEISLVKSLDPGHPIMITDSGELGIWIQAAKRSDVFGTSIYRVVYNKYIGNYTYPLPPKFFWIKANIVRLLYPDKPIIVSELQAEPWGPKLIYETPLEDQFKSMDFQQFNDDIEYAKQVGFKENYLWGAEWWYWLKTEQNHPEFWDAARKLIQNNE